MSFLEKKNSSDRNRKFGIIEKVVQEFKQN